MKKKTIVLAYSGGLDTSVILHWLKENYNANVIAYIDDLGQKENLKAIAAQAKRVGASKVYVEDLRNEFSKSFIKADSVILCPIYTAGEKIKLGFNYLNFAKDIIKNSRTKVYMVKNQYELAKFIKQNIYGKKIVIGMGAGSISNWIKELPSLIK